MEGDAGERPTTHLQPLQAPLLPSPCQGRRLEPRSSQCLELSCHQQTISHTTLEGKGILSETSNKSTESHAVFPESGAREPMGGKAQQELEMRELWVQRGSGKLGVG